MMSTGTIYPSYVGSNDVREYDNAFRRIVKALVARNACFLIGAGMSLENKIPAGLGLAEKLLRLFFSPGGTSSPSDERLQELAAKFPFEAIVWAVERSLGNGRTDLTNELKRLLLDEKIQPKNEIYHDFLSVLWNGNKPAVHAIFTTNYDELLERYFGNDLAASVTPDNYLDEYQQIQESERLPIIHLRGKLDGRYEINEEEIFNETFTAELKEEFHLSLFKSDTFVFVGYSMNDPDFRLIYHDYRRLFLNRKGHHKVTYVVSPSKDEFEWQLGKEIWSARNVIWIPLKSSEFFAHLKRIRDKEFDSEAMEFLKRQLGIEDERVIMDLIARTAKSLNLTEEEARNFYLELHDPTTQS